MYILFFSAQSPAAQVQGSGLLIADSLTVDQVPDVTRKSNQLLQRPATSDRVLTG